MIDVGTFKSKDRRTLPSGACCRAGPALRLEDFVQFRVLRAGSADPSIDTVPGWRGSIFKVLAVLGWHMS